MTHVAAAIPDLDHSCDTHCPWNSADDVFVPGVLEFRDGEVAVLAGPGLGVESGMRSRDDTGYMRRIHPEYELRLPRW
jgi:glucarate dehydratase